MKTFIICLASLGIVLTSCSQDIAVSKVPSVVKNALQVKHPGAANVEWEKKKNNIYEAEFGPDSAEVTIKIDATGKIIIQKQKIQHNMLPADIVAAIQNYLKDHTLDGADKLEKDGKVFYQVELESNGKKDVRLVFADSGTESKDVPYWD